ncbi:ImmA/IrrE family metallo-endopeptidase [Nostoc sp. FACHB-280]|uniref:ImmA/IrrE family metallo-endopeptidase n=1 Tax=Nostoc sp. FACHB-280 TaxID=2692839 RepID=UPI001F5597F7|nr:ImmA/IrrE family metallo-endopeptidase [Nostoc sp. FACHB-280]
MAISQAVEQAYQEAGLELVNLKPGVVPLYELIKAYPIRVAEIKDMTIQSISDFLEVETGQKLLFTDNENENLKLAGYLYLQEYQSHFYGCILVEKKPHLAPISRRRFSAAHELGHYLLHFLPLLQNHHTSSLTEPLILTEGLYIKKENEKDDVDEEDIQEEQEKSTAQFTCTNGIKAAMDNLGIDEKEMEEEADQFAAELLIPTSACFALAKKFHGRFGKTRKVLAKRLSSEFLVSQKAMERRLQDLDLPEKLLNSSLESTKQWEASIYKWD